MNTLHSLITRKEEQLKTLQGRIDATLRRRNAAAEELGNLRHVANVDENQVASLKREKDDLDHQLDGFTTQREQLEAELTEARVEQRADELVAEAQNRTIPGASLPYDNSKESTMTTTSLSVREPRTYTAERAAAGDSSFLRDLFAGQVRNDPDALERLRRHGDEARVESPQLVERAVSTGGVAAFTPPQYLVSLFAEYLRAGRPLANLCNTSVPLPAEGMVVNIPRITTSTSTAVQAAEGDVISNQDLDDTTLAIPVVTIGGYVDVTRQALERGHLVEELIFADLAADYATRLDTQLISGSGSGGQHQGILGTSGIANVTYTDASPTLAEMWPKLADALGRVISTRYTGATAIVMRPNMWAWMLSALGTDGRPLIATSDTGANNAFALQLGTEYAAVAGTLQGVPVVLDGNMPNNLGTGTNESVVIVADFRDALLMEEQGGVPVQLRFDDVLSSSLKSRLVAYGYSAFSAGRQPTAFAKITGTGLIVPTL